MIEVEHLSKSFGAIKAVNDVSFEIQKGEIVGFLGPNAAGKTTTMRLLTCFLPTDKGTARVGGYDIHEHPLEVRKQIGYLPENAPLYPDMTVLEYLHFIAEVRGIPKEMRNDRIKEMIKICGLPSVVYRGIGELSKGFRQRVGLAQTMIHDPDILILDEPTSGLDPNQIVEIRELIKEIGKEKTVILSTHILPEVQATCGRIIIINEGILAGSGTPDELRNRARGMETIETTIRGPREEVEAKLKGFEEIEEISATEEDGADGDGLVHYTISCKSGTDLREDLFKMVAASGWTLTELRKETVSLEDVFKKLTTGDVL